MRAQASLASRSRVAVTVAGAWSRSQFRPRGCGFGGHVFTASWARPVPRSSVGLASSSGPSLSGVVSRLTIRSSRTHIRAAPKCAPSAIFALSRRPAAGRLNSGVMRGQARSVSCGLAAALGPRFSSRRDIPDTPWRKPWPVLPPPLLAGPLSGHRIPALAGVRSLQPHRFTYSNWLHNNSIKGKPLRGSPYFRR
jgi:hypothetical protein